MDCCKWGWTLKLRLFASLYFGSGRLVSIWLLVVNFNISFLIGFSCRADTSTIPALRQASNVRRNFSSMQKTFPIVWISSVEHLDAFSDISKKNPWWKILLGINKIPDNFPQVKIGSRKYPIVFYSEGSLNLFERELEFIANPNASVIRGNFFNLMSDLRFEFDFGSVKVDRFKHSKPFMKAFNISWIQLSIKNDLQNQILLSVGGSGLNINQITKTNEEIFQFLKRKSEYVQ